MDSGTPLGPYRIERELGSGGMGKVYAAVVEGRCPGLDDGTRVALKVVHAHLLETPGYFKRFLREGEIGKAVRHPNVVRTYDCDQVVVDGRVRAFLVMEHVEGQTLRELLDDLGSVPEGLCRHIAREVCKGLTAMHAAGVIHRDMKPDNVIISLSEAMPDDPVAEAAPPQHERVVKVMDLGVARLQDEQLRLSQTGAFVGSIHYAAPECFQGGGKDVDGRADLHALGLVLYELASGISPYFGDTVPEILEKVLHEEPRRLGEVNPQLSPFFEEVVHNLLAKSPDERFASAAELLGVLEEGEDSVWWHARARVIQATSKRPLRRIRIPRETAVYGRETEIATLRGLFERAQAGDGQVVLIEGEAGIGKSRLVDEAISRLQRDGEDVNFLFGSYPPNGAATASGAFSAAFREQFGEGGCADHLSQTPILVPAFAALLNGESAPAGVEPLTKDSLQTCFVTALRSLAAERPTVLMIDDLHFAPEEARALFTALAMAVPGHRVLLIGTTRPEVTEAWRAGLDRFDHTTRLAPQRLAAKDLVRLLEDAFASKALAESLGLRIIVKSDGNPFFAFEIIRGLREGQFITQKDDGTWVSTRVVDEIEIPSSVLDLVNARVADLDDDERNLLDVAACWGYSFDASLVGEALGLRRLPVLQAMAKIEKRDRLVRSSGRDFVFDHHQVQEALYGALPEMLREEYHAALAEALEARTKAAEKDPESIDGALCVDLCEHWLKGARGESALRYLAAAQAHLTNGYLHAEAAALTERALAVPGLLVGAERARALLRLARALDSLGRRTRQEECTREAERLAEAAGDDELRGSAATDLGTLFSHTSRLAEAEAAHRCAEQIAVARGDRQAEADALGGLGNVFQSLVRLPEAQEFQERCLALRREGVDRRGEAVATGNLGNVLYVQGRLAEAQELYERQLALSREIGHRQAEATATASLGNVLFVQGRLGEARECYERYLAVSREMGDRRGEAIATGSLGIVFRKLGRLRESQEHYERSIARSREIGHRSVEANNTGNLGNVFASLGRIREARVHVERYLALSREIEHPTGVAIALLNLGGLHRDEGETARAEERLLESLAVSEGIGHRGLTADTHLALGLLRAAAGDAEGARGSFATAREMAAEIGIPDVETLARCGLACLPGGDADDALAAFTEHEPLLAPEGLLAARHLLFDATGDRAHLVEAKRLLDESLAMVPEEYHESMLSNIQVNRDLMAAWTRHGATDAVG